ncbi:MAG: hypothetical protein AAGK97_06475, partial [Bacteroidota bacterium]
MKSQFSKIIFGFLTFILSYNLSIGQDLNIQLTISPPYPSNLDAYVDRLELGILSVDNTTNNPIEAYFQAVLEETSGRFSVQTDGILGDPVTIEPGLSILSPIDIQTIFAGLSENDFTTTGLTQQQIDAIYLSRQMPEGNYRLCIRAFDEIGNLISNNLEDNCTEFEILYPERPVIISPFEGEYVDTTGFLNPVWDHLLNDADAITRTEYVLKIIDLTEQSILPNKAIEAMLDPGVSPEYEENVGNLFSTTLQNDIELPLIVGHQYAMRVTAVDPDGILAYQFGGHSEVVLFFYGPEEEEAAIGIIEAPKITSPERDQIVDARGGINVKWDQNLDALGDNLTAADSFAYNVRLLALKKRRVNLINRIFENPNTEFLHNEKVYAKSNYIPISTRVPLVVGERYAVQVIQTDLDLLAENIEIENDGKSEIIIFTYGDPNEDFQPDLDTLLANHVQGQISWTFKSSEESQEDLGFNQTVSSASELKPEQVTYGNNNDIAGAITYPLEEAIIKIVGNSWWSFWWGSRDIIVGAGTSDANGRYAVRLNDHYLSILSNLRLEISHPSGAFEKISKRITLTKTEFGYLMEPEKVAANSMRFTAQILKEDFVDTDNMTINLLMQKDNFANYPHLAQIAPNNGNDLVSYNNDDYVVAQTLDKTSVSKKIFQNHFYYEHYVAEIKQEGKASIYYPLQSYYFQKNQFDKKALPIVHKNFIYNVGTELAGVVFYGNSIRQRDAIVKVLLEQEDVAGTLDTRQEYIRVTDELGKYHFEIGDTRLNS